MSLALRTNGLARELLQFDPFFTPRAFSPAFEAKDTPESYVLKADLPGIDEKALDISIDKGVLTVSGSRAAEQRKDGETFTVYERRFGSFSRSFQLPDIADADKVEAKLENGVLTLTIGKKAEAKPRKIALRR